MSFISYKFRSERDFRSFPISGCFISIEEFKTRIFASCGTGKGFTLLVTDAKSDRLIDDKELIPARSCVIIRRVPEFGTTYATYSVGSRVIRELRCLLCSDTMKDAAMTTCCFVSFCQKCITDHVLSGSACICRRKIEVGEIIPNITIRQLVNRYLNRSKEEEKDDSLNSKTLLRTSNKRNPIFACITK